MKPGIYPDLSFPEYRALSAWGSSDLKAFRVGPPARVLWERANERGDTDATRFGTAVHAAVLTPRLYAETYAVKPEGMTFASKDGKAWRDGQQGKTIISAADASRVEAILAAIDAKPAARAALEGGRTESSYLWSDPDTGEACKARADLIDAHGYIYDLKVTRYAGARLAWAAYTQGWCHQFAHYRAGLVALGADVPGCRIIAVHPEAPHYVHLAEVRAADLDVMGMENIETLGRMKACREANDWPGTPDEWTRLDIPQYAIESTVGALDLSGAEEVEGG